MTATASPWAGNMDAFCTGDYEQPKCIVVITCLRVNTQCPLCLPFHLMNFMHLYGTQQDHIFIHHQQSVSEIV